MFLFAFSAHTLTLFALNRIATCLDCNVDQSVVAMGQDALCSASMPSATESAVYEEGKSSSGWSLIQRKHTIALTLHVEAGIDGSNLEALTFHSVFHNRNAPMIPIVLVSACAAAILVACAVVCMCCTNAGTDLAGVVGADRLSTQTSTCEQETPKDGTGQLSPCDSSDPSFLMAPVHASSHEPSFGQGAILRDMVAGNNPMLLSLCTTVLLQVLGISILIPVLPFFAIEELQLGPTQMGLVSSASSIAQLVGSSACGRLSDSMGRRPLLVISCIWGAVGFGATAFTTSFVPFIAVRFLQGLGGGANALFDAYLLDIIPAAQRPSVFGLFGCVGGVGFIFGPGLAMGLLSMGLPRYGIILVASGFCSLAALWSAFFVKESLDPEKRRPLCGKQAVVESTTQSTKNLDIISSGLVSLWLFRLLTATAQGFLYAVYAFLIRDFFGWADRQLVVVLALSGVVSLVLQSVVYPRFGSFGWRGSAAALALGSASGSIGYALLVQPKVLFHAFGMLGFTIAAGLVEPSITVLIGTFAGERHKGFATGVTGSMRSLASVGAPLLGGFLYERGVAYACVVGCMIFTASSLFPIAILRSGSTFAQKRKEAERGD